MSAESAPPSRLEPRLAGLLQYGTWLASAMIGLGLALSAGGWSPGAGLSSMDLVAAGIGCFVVLPVLRVMVMLVGFARARDPRLAVVAAVVLVILFLGFALGMVRSPAA